MVEIFSSNSNEEAIRFASVALRARLYVSGWLLCPTLKEIQLRPEGHRVLLALENGTPVGAAVALKNGEAHFFVRKSVRRQGIGKALVNALTSIPHPGGKKYSTSSTRVPGSYELLSNHPKIDNYDFYSRR